MPDLDATREQQTDAGDDAKQNLMLDRAEGAQQAKPESVLLPATVVLGIPGERG